MTADFVPPLDACTLERLFVEDEASFRHVALYADLKQVLIDAGYGFRVLPPNLAGRWDRALLLNLTFWKAEAGEDVLVDRCLSADVVAHAAWHHLAARALSVTAGSSPSAASMILGESVASAFDLYLVGRLLGHAPDSTFLETQVPAMTEAADAAGLDATEFETLLQEAAADPERAFAELRELLFDAAMGLLACKGIDEGHGVLARLDSRRFAPLLSRYELSNWVLHARAFACRDEGANARALAIERELRGAAVPLDWLEKHWVQPALKG
jgi:hypothetical protein